jgi:hypothetical protein
MSDSEKPTLSVATIIVGKFFVPRCSQSDAVLAAVKAWPGSAEPALRAKCRPSLTAAARGVRGEAGRDEETALRSN